MAPLTERAGETDSVIEPVILASPPEQGFGKRGRRIALGAGFTRGQPRIPLRSL